MRTSDVFRLALAALWQQKSRTVMTTLGVVFGSLVLAASLSIGQGVQDTIHRESHRSDYLRRVTVRPNWRGAEDEASADELPLPGEMSDEKRDRIRGAIRKYTNNNPVPVTRETLTKIEALDHVDDVVPIFYQRGYASLNDKSQLTAVAAARAQDTDCQRRLVGGRVFETSDEPSALVSEFLLYRWGLINDADAESVLGKKIRVELREEAREQGFQVHLLRGKSHEATLNETLALEKIQQKLPEALDRFDLTAEQIDLLRTALSESKSTAPTVTAGEFTVVGVLRLPTPDEKKLPWDPLRTDADLVLPYRAAEELFFRVPGSEKRGVDQAVVVIDDENHTKEVFQAVEAMGVQAFSLLEYIEQQKLIYLLIFGGMTCVATVALLVAALGIANTMLMSVLERTREIGVMKAVGAGNAQLQAVFVIEGFLIGSVGGCLGVLVAWAASYPGDAWVKSRVAAGVPVELKDPLFVFPPWLIVVTLAFAVIATTLAAFYPARRAAKIDPVAALRHE